MSQQQAYSRNLVFVLMCYPASIFCFPRRLQDVFSVTIFSLQDVFAIHLPKMSSRRLPKMSSRCVCKTSSSRQFQDVLQLCLEDVFKTSSRLIGRQKNITLKISSVRRGQDECLLGSRKEQDCRQDLWGLFNRQSETKINALSKKCQYLELFQYVFSRIWTGNEEIQSILRGKNKLSYLADKVKVNNQSAKKILYTYICIYIYIYMYRKCCVNKK